MSTPSSPSPLPAESRGAESDPSVEFITDQAESPLEPANVNVNESTFVATAAGVDDPPPLVRGSVNRLLLWLAPASLVVFMIFGAVPSLMIPHQLEILDAANKQANLGIVLSISAFCAMVSAPIAGQISDRTRSRFGRRAPWIILGACAGTLALVGLAFATSVIGIAIAWAIVQVAYSFVQGPLSTILPDRVPRRRRGTFSAVLGIALMAGSLVGTIVATLLYDSILAGYLFLSLTALLVLMLFVIVNPDYSSRGIEIPPFRWLDFVRTFWINPIKHPDFFWAFTARLMLFTGYYAISGFQLYLISDYLGVKNAQNVLPIVAVIALAGIVLSSVIAGPLSDRVGRRKPFVFGSSLVMASALVIPWVWPTLTAWFIMVGVLSLGFGIYGAVDQALMTEVLPSAQSFAKDLGVINIAATLPQTIGPALAGAVIALWGYPGLFPVAIVFALVGAFAIWPVKSVR